MSKSQFRTTAPQQAQLVESEDSGSDGGDSQDGDGRRNVGFDIEQIDGEEVVERRPGEGGARDDDNLLDMHLLPMAIVETSIVSIPDECQ